MPESRLVVHAWKAIVKNTLQGFASIELPNGLYIDDISIHQKNGKWWSAMPSVPMLENGQHRIKDGKPQYKSIMRWRSRELGDQFSVKLIAAIKDQHPGALS